VTITAQILMPLESFDGGDGDLYVEYAGAIAGYSKAGSAIGISSGHNTSLGIFFKSDMQPPNMVSWFSPKAAVTDTDYLVEAVVVVASNSAGSDPNFLLVDFDLNLTHE
jgi:hypothetical protein